MPTTSVSFTYAVTPVVRAGTHKAHITSTAIVVWRMVQASTTSDHGNGGFLGSAG